MFNRKNPFSLLMILSLAILLIASGCKEEETPARSTRYDLTVKDVLGVSGTVTFTETNSLFTTIDIVLVNSPAGTHPAYLYMNSVIEHGQIALTLNPVDANGKSTTVVTTMNYSQLIAYDGHIKILQSTFDPFTVVAQADIGGNVLTTTHKSYALSQLGEFGVSGTALLEKRLNGNTLLTISLTGVIAGDTYPATVNLGSVASVGGGPVIKTLNNVNGTSGKSYTNIQKLDGGTDITYENWLVYDGYINVYQSTILTENIITHGNIGSN